MLRIFSSAAFLNIRFILLTSTEFACREDDTGVPSFEGVRLSLAETTLLSGALFSVPEDERGEHGARIICCKFGLLLNPKGRTLFFFICVLNSGVSSSV
ncbi:hypothetical protein YC2023_072462 [Brassica napus]